MTKEELLKKHEEEVAELRDFAEHIKDNPLENEGIIFEKIEDKKDIDEQE